MWRRFLAETIDFILLHIFKIVVILFLSHYFDIIDQSRLTLTHIISNLLYEETFSFPIELICVEFGYVLASITFEVIDIILMYFLIRIAFVEFLSYTLWCDTR